MKSKTNKKICQGCGVHKDFQTLEFGFCSDCFERLLKEKGECVKYEKENK